MVGNKKEPDARDWHSLAYLFCRQKWNYEIPGHNISKQVRDPGKKYSESPRLHTFALKKSSVEEHQASSYQLNKQAGLLGFKK